MTVGELRSLIRDLPDDTPLVERRHSDYGPVDSTDVQVRRAVRKDDGSWYMRDHSTLPATAQRVTVLFFNGN